MTGFRPFFNPATGEWIEFTVVAEDSGGQQGRRAIPGAGTGAVSRRPAGFILTGPDLAERWTLQREPYLLETSTPGVFATGDVRHGSVKRVASAVGDGSIAIRLVHDYLA